MWVWMSTTVDFVGDILEVVLLVVRGVGEVDRMFLFLCSWLETGVSYAKQRKCSRREKTYRLWTCQVKRLLYEVYL